MRKKILFGLLFVFVWFTAIPQQAFSIAADTSTTYGNPNASAIFCFAYVANQSPDTIWLNWNRKTESYPNGWNLTICDEWTCYDDTVFSGTFYVLAGDTSPIIGHFIPSGIPGTGIVNVDIWDPLDSLNNSFEVVFVAIAVPLAVDPIERNDFGVNMYPVPVNENTILEFAGIGYQEVTTEIYNIQGQLINRIKTSNNRVSMNVHLWPKGTYIYRSYNDQGNTVSGKFVVE